MLYIVGCLELKNIPESLGNLIYLAELEVLMCSNLNSLTDYIDKLEQLKRLVIGYWEIARFPQV